MRYSSFSVQNYRGIQNLTLDLDVRPHGNVFTLVGLNESGKTTLLEALAFFYDSLRDRDEVRLYTGSKVDVHNLIPKRQRDNFNGDISIAASFQLFADDKHAIQEAVETGGLICVHIPDTMTIHTHCQFENSSFVKKRNSWTHGIRIRESRRSKQERALHSNHSSWNAVWQKVLAYLPPIIYYPNFLFEFPERIYLEMFEGEGREQAFYRQLFQDVLDSLGSQLTTQAHVIDRTRSAAPQDRASLGSVIDKVGIQISKTVLNPNLGIFQSNLSNKSIVVVPPEQDDDHKVVFVSIKLKDGQDSYFIDERSLGFRWLFTFLLFTQFRIHRRTPSAPVFLLDEPASNLHQTAQRRLLEAIRQLTSSTEVVVIYTTHSPHLINPDWLENAFVIANEALDYDTEDTYSSAMTNIKAERYRVFADLYPDKRSYYQTILDLLEYQPGLLEDVPDVIMVEGKNDFYSLTLLSRMVDSAKLHLRFLPGVGAGTLDTPIQLYTAWGRNFIILLDGDGEGESQRQRYLDKFGPVVTGRVFTLADVDKRWRKLGLERLFQDADRLALQQAAFPESKQFRKKLFNQAIQEHLARGHSVSLTAATLTNFEQLLEWLSERLNAVRGLGA